MTERREYPTWRMWCEGGAEGTCILVEHRSATMPLAEASRRIFEFIEGKRTILELVSDPTEGGPGSQNAAYVPLDRSVTLEDFQKDPGKVIKDSMEGPVSIVTATGGVYAVISSPCLDEPGDPEESP